MPHNPHANFSPTLDGYSGQTPFRYWCQLALPLTYDDSLSYYELLNKVVTYLNNTIEDVANVETNVGRLSDAYNQLQNYVNDYFDNIDIEQELRTVLDRMALDGSLDEILSPIVELQLPDVVEDQIDNVVGEQIDGSVGRQLPNVVREQLPPIAAESIPTEVTDWLSENVTPVGGAVTIDKSLTVENSAADAKVTGNMIGNVEGELSSIMDKDYAELKYLNGFDEKYVKYANGELTTTASTYATNYIDISKFSKIKYKRTGTTYATTQAGMAFYSDKNEGSYISGIRAAISQSASGYVSELYEAIVPYGAKYARFTVYKDTITYGDFAVYGNLKDKILTGSKAIITNLSKGLISATDESLSDRNGCYSSRIILTDESVLTVKENASGNIFFYDGNNEYIGKIDATGAINKTAGDWLNLSGTINIKDYAPKNATSFKFAVSPTDSTVLTDETYVAWANNHYSLYTKKTFTPTKLRIATFNTHDFTGSGISQSQSTMYYRIAISKADCDVLATQEDVTTYASNDPYVSIYKAFFSTQQRINKEGRNKFNCCSNQVLLEVTKHQFSTYNAHPYYVDYVLLIENKKIHIVNIHLDWYDKNMRATQISELLEYISDFEYVIVIGDFNPFNYLNGEPVDQSNPIMYEEDFSIWTNAGYNIANGSSCGTFDTVVALADGQWYPCDNIVTSKNIKIKYANVVSESWMDDHKILYADLDIL